MVRKQVMPDGTPEGLFSFGDRLAWARSRKGITQKALSEVLDKSRTTIAQYELGKIAPPLPVIQELADELSIDPRYLAFGLPNDGPRGPVEGARAVPLVRYVNGQQTEEGEMWMPPVLLDQLGLEAGAKAAVLDNDATALGYSAGDRLFLDISGDEIRPDGGLYAVQSSAGVSMVRSEPLLDLTATAEVLLTYGNGQVHRTSPKTIIVIGRVLGAIKKA